jgi:hypothetical protein
MLLRGVLAERDTTMQEITASSQKVSGKSLLWLFIIVLVLLAVGGGGKALQQQLGKSMSSTANINASVALSRISQEDSSQYASQSEFAIWSPSACSATSMTEVINSYGHSYRIADILKVERQAHAISADQGLLYGVDSIRTTVRRFGFSATDLSGATLESIIATANAGQPVIVSFPPQTWTGGHILVLRGGTDQTINLADSSQYNLTTISRAKFLKYWRGFAVVISPEATGGKQYYIDLARQDAVDAGIDPDKFIRQIDMESGFQPDITSGVGAIGIAQLMPETAAGLGVDPHDPEASLKAAAHIMAAHLQHYHGDYAKALAAYNAGSGTVGKAVAKGGANWKQYLPHETQHYIDAVLS